MHSKCDLQVFFLYDSKLWYNCVLQMESFFEFFLIPSEMFCDTISHDLLVDLPLAGYLIVQLETLLRPYLQMLPLSTVFLIKIFGQKKCH